MIKGQLTDKLKASIVKIINKWIDLPHFRIFIFGSRVNGKADERSDIDIGIEAPTEIAGNLMVEIQAELAELPILQKIDFVDFRTVSEGFRRVAQKQIEVIYER